MGFGNADFHELFGAVWVVQQVLARVVAPISSQLKLNQHS